MAQSSSGGIRVRGVSSSFDTVVLRKGPYGEDYVMWTATVRWHHIFVTHATTTLIDHCRMLSRQICWLLWLPCLFVAFRKKKKKVADKILPQRVGLLWIFADPAGKLSWKAVDCYMCGTIFLTAYTKIWNLFCTDSMVFIVQFFCSFFYVCQLMYSLKRF